MGKSTLEKWFGLPQSPALKVVVILIYGFVVVLVLVVAEALIYG